MDTQLDFPQGTLTIEQQALVEALDRFLALHPENGDEGAALRLTMHLLELADVAPQEVIAQAAGYRQARSLRAYKRRFGEEGLRGFLDKQPPGRLPVTTCFEVEGAVVQAILEAVVAEHKLPRDEALAQEVNRLLEEKASEHAGAVTASMVQTVRLRWGIGRWELSQQLDAVFQDEPSNSGETRLGRTRWGGAFILAVLSVEEGLLRFAHLLPMAPGYAVTSVQWLLTAIFSVICGVERAFHLDDIRDVGFALLTGRPRPLSHGTFQHLLHAIPGWDVVRFYLATAKQAVHKLGEGDKRISLDGHVLPRYTKLVELAKARLASCGRVLKAEELVLAFDLDEETFLGLRVGQGGKNLSQVLLALVEELRGHRGGMKDLLRLFFDRGGYKGLIFQILSELPDVHFYCPAVRYTTNVEQWESLTEEDFEPEPFIFDKHASRPSDEQPRFRLADTLMEINVWEDHRLTGTVEVRATVVHDSKGRTPAERWPFVLLMDDRHTPARDLVNEWGDHWRQEFAHRVGKHDLAFDILPPGYTLTTTRDEDGHLQRQVEFDPTSFFLSAWLRCLVFNLMTRFGQALEGECAKMWAGTLLRKFIRRPATLYLVGKELHVVFDPFPDQEKLRPLLEELNAKRMAIPWLNELVIQFSIAGDEPVHPLKEPEKRNRIFGHQ
jgi:hypothetical protein